MTGSSEEVFYRIEKSSNKGYGLFATKKIHRGQLILCEKPLLVIDRTKYSLSNQILEQLSKLSVEDKAKFYALYDCYLPDTPTEIGINETNCLPLGSGSNFSGIFPTISRINHSCAPNVYHSWSDVNKVETIYAVKDIEENEEILTSYIDLYVDKATRQKQLKKLFRFECGCELCSKSVTENKKSDIRRKILSQLDEEVASLAWSMPDKAVTKAEQMLKYLKDEDMYYMANYVGRVCYDVFQILFITKKNSNMQNWARLALQNYMICSGSYDCTLKKQLEFYSNQP